MGAYPTGSEVTITTVDAAVPEYWEPEALRARVAKAVISKPEIITFKMAKGKKFGDNYDFTELSEFSTNAVGADGAVANQTWTHTLRQVAIGTWREITITVTDRAAIQSILDYGDEFAEHAGKVIAQYQDDAVYDDHGSFTGSNNIGDTGSPTEMSDDFALDSMVVLDNADIPAEDRSWHFSPRAKSKLLKLDKFTISSALGVGKGRQLTGEFGELYGSKVLVSSRVVSTGSPSVHKNLYIHKQAIAMVMERTLNIELLARVSKATTYSADVLFGESVIRTSHGVTINTRA